MPALFCLALHPALERLRAALPDGAEAMAYLDDIYIICDWGNVSHILTQTRQILSEVCHIDVNIGKLAAWSRNPAPCPPGLENFGANIWKSDRPLQDRGVKVLGTPLGSQPFIAQFGAKLAEEEEQLLNFLPKLPSLQAAWLMLYFCAVPRINHLLRTLSPEKVHAIAAAHDARVLATFCRSFGIPEESGWDMDLHRVGYQTWVSQSRLPLRLAGAGLRDSTRTSFAAHWASWADTLPDLMRRFPSTGQRMLTTLTGLQALDDEDMPVQPACLIAAEGAGRRCSRSGWTERPMWIDIAAGVRPPEPPRTEMSLGEWSHGWQFHGSNAMEQQAHKQLLQELAWPSLRVNAIATGKARLHSCMGPFASTWLIVSPTSDLLRLADAELQCAMRRRLGIAVLFDGEDTHGHSCLTTNRGGRLNIRHLGMLMAWRQVFKEAGGQVPDRNIERLLRNTHVPIPPDDQRRLDIIVPGLNVARGLPLFCDVTVVSPISRSGAPRPGTSNRGGRLLEDAEEDNDQTYSEVISSGLGSLQCLGAEVFGRWAPHCVKLVPALARERTRGLHARVRKGAALGLQHRWWGLLGIALQRAVANIVLHDWADLLTTQLEPCCPLADLEVV